MTKARKPTVRMVAVGDLTPNPKNPRSHPDGHVDQLVRSIEQYGFTNPILISAENVIVAGHGRHLAAQRLGMAEVPCIVLDGLTPDQLRAYVVADNQLTLASDWDGDLLRDYLKDIDTDLFELGFSEDELALWLDPWAGDEPPAPSSTPGNLTKSDAEIRVTVPAGKRTRAVEAIKEALANAGIEYTVARTLAT